MFFFFLFFSLIRSGADGDGPNSKDGSDISLFPSFTHFHILVLSFSFLLVLYPAFDATHTHTHITSGFGVTNARTRVGVLLHIHFSHKSVISHRERKGEVGQESRKRLCKIIFNFMY